MKVIPDNHWFYCSSLKTQVIERSVMTYFPLISMVWELSTETRAKDRSGLQNPFFFFFFFYMYVYVIYVNESQLPSPNVYSNSFQFLALFYEDRKKVLCPFNSFLRCCLEWLIEWVLDNKLRGCVIKEVSYQNPIKEKKILYKKKILESKQLLIVLILHS